SSYQPGEPVGPDALAAFAAAAYGGDDPLAGPDGDGPLTIPRTSMGAVLRIDLPFATRADVDLARHGDELVVTVGSYRRLFALPAPPARAEGAGAPGEGGGARARHCE